MRVQYKLFIITLVASLTLVALMLGLAQWSFDRGLLQHVNQRASSQYEKMLEPLANLYRQYGSWDFMSQRSHLWEYVKSEAGIDSPPSRLHPSDRKERYGDRPQRQGPPKDHQRDHRRPPPRGDFGYGPPKDRRGFDGPHRSGGYRDGGPRYKDERKRDNRSETGSYDSEKRRPPKRPGGEPLSLVDENKEFVIGRLAKPEHRQYIPIIVNDRTVGYVSYANRERLMDDYDLDFAKELRENLWWIAAIMILLSASLALPFSHLLLTPLRPIVNTIHKLATGDLAARVKVESQDEIGRVANDVNHLAQSLSDNDESRKQWLANISHELRTPLAVMRGELEAMLDGIREINRDHIESAHQEALHLQRLVEDLYQLTSSDIGALSYHKSDLDICELIEDDLERFTPLINQSGLHLEFFNRLEDSDQTWVNGDRQRISQLFHNLIQNSIKYTEQPGTIRVTLDGNDRYVTLNVEDSKPGVATEDLEKIFDHLYRTEESRNRKTGGSGLGLAICKKIIEGHDGKISATQSKLGGVNMKITLPLI